MQLHWTSCHQALHTGLGEGPLPQLLQLHLPSLLAAQVLLCHYFWLPIKYGQKQHQANPPSADWHSKNWLYSICVTTLQLLAMHQLNGWLMLSTRLHMHLLALALPHLCFWLPISWWRASSIKAAQGSSSNEDTALWGDANVQGLTLISAKGLPLFWCHMTCGLGLIQGCASSASSACFCCRPNCNWVPKSFEHNSAVLQFSLVKQMAATWTMDLTYRHGQL